MRLIMMTIADLRNYVDDVTSGWYDRRDEDIDAIVLRILALPNCPRYGADWSDFLENMPESVFSD